MNEEANATQHVTDASQSVPQPSETVQRQAEPMQQQTVLYQVPAQARPAKVDTEQTKRMKESFEFFGPVTFLYALFYTFCMFKNDAGVTFPFFIAASLLYLYFSLSKLGLTLKKGSGYYMTGMMLLAVSTFCTDDARIIAFNKTGIFLLMMSLLLKQFYETSGWKLGKYLFHIFVMVFASIAELERPFQDAARYVKKQDKTNKTVWYVLLGAVSAVPLLVIVIALLASADAFFRQYTDQILSGVNPENLAEIVFRVLFVFFAAYLLLSFLCKHTLSEEVKDYRHGEPVLAITITGLLSVIYVLFSGIQIFGLFLGKLQLPAGYTYAEYAREGFFQLLAVSILNLIIVLGCMSFFRESKALKGVLTVMSLCTFVMIASSAMRMIIYIRYYYLTFLRILVLWALALLFVLFLGVIASIYREKFPLFKYSVAVVTVLYLVLSFSHPDFIIAYVNVRNTHKDYFYLSELSADAAPVLIPYLKELGYDFEAMPDLDHMDPAEASSQRNRFWTDRWEEGLHRSDQDGFGYYYLERMQRATGHLGIRTYNVSRHMAMREIALARTGD